MKIRKEYLLLTAQAVLLLLTLLSAGALFLSGGTEAAEESAETAEREGAFPVTEVAESDFMFEAEEETAGYPEAEIWSMETAETEPGAEPGMERTVYGTASGERGEAFTAVTETGGNHAGTGGEKADDRGEPAGTRGEDTESPGEDARSRGGNAESLWGEDAESPGEDARSHGGNAESLWGEDTESPEGDMESPGETSENPGKILGNQELSPGTSLEDRTAAEEETDRAESAGGTGGDGRKESARSAVNKKTTVKTGTTAAEAKMKAAKTGTKETEAKAKTAKTGTKEAEAKTKAAKAGDGQDQKKEKKSGKSTGIQKEGKLKDD